MAALAEAPLLHHLRAAAVVLITMQAERPPHLVVMPLQEAAEALTITVLAEAHQALMPRQGAALVAQAIHQAAAVAAAQVTHPVVVHLVAVAQAIHQAAAVAVAQVTRQAAAHLVAVVQAIHQAAAAAVQAAVVAATHQVVAAAVQAVVAAATHQAVAAAVQAAVAAATHQAVAVAVQAVVVAATHQAAAAAVQAVVVALAVHQDLQEGVAIKPPLLSPTSIPII